MYLFFNHQLVHETEAKISVFDHGYLYGLGFFETFRTYTGAPFLLEEHLRRIKQATERARIMWEPDPQRLKEQIEQLLGANHLEDGYFRYNVSAGQAPIGLPTAPYQQPTELLFCKVCPPPPQQKQLVTVTLHRNSPEDQVRYKSHHYLNNILAKYETPEGYEGILLTSQGYVAEGTVSNLFFVKGDKLYTPALSTGILPGITRDLVIALARELGVEVVEGEFARQYAQEAEEVFVTNSIQELVPVTVWDSKAYPSNKPNTLTSKLQQAYRDYIMSKTALDFK